MGSGQAMYIGGKFVQSADHDVIDSIDPGRGKSWARVACAGRRDVDDAVDAARRAFVGGWRTTPGDVRGKILHALANEVDRDAAELALTESLDTGKTLSEARAEIDTAVRWVRYCAQLADGISGESWQLSEAARTGYIIWEPIGVVGAITPWNSPLMMAIWKIAPAIAAGNCIVLKPAELAPVTSLRLAGAIDRIGVPRGVINIVPGLGDVAGARLAEHPDVGKLAFTGSTATGQAIAKAAARRFSRVHLECGGKSAQLVFADCNFNRAFEGCFRGMFANSGQQCSVGSRVLVERSIFSQFVERFADRARDIVVGDPQDERTEQGAIISRCQLDRVDRYVKRAKAEGRVDVLCGGDVVVPDDPDLREGFFYAPTVLTGAEPASEIWQDEIFGPVVAISPFDSEEEAVSLANDSKYGLVAGVWTRSLARAQRLGSALQVGVVWINMYRRHYPQLPYGGRKMSGMGRENGMIGLHEYLEAKTLVIDSTD